MTMLSIVIPVYQVRLYLKRCLNSVLEQTYKDFEIILVDDGSTDGSGEICDEYAKIYSNIRVIHKSNGGLSSARNAGIDAASGQLIMFVDSDDVIHNRLAETEIGLIQRENADAAVCRFRRFSDEEICLSAETGTDNYTLMSGLEAENQLLEDETQTHFTSSCGKIFQKKLFDNVRFPEGRLFEDEFAIIRLYYQCERIAVIDEEMYFYFINSAGITQTLDLNKRFDEYDAQMERIAFFQEKGLEELKRKAILRFLKSAQWDLIRCQKKSESHDPSKGEAFQKQYTAAAKMAIRDDLIDFAHNYDYYVLAFPKKRSYLRFKRFAMKLTGRMD